MPQGTEGGMIPVTVNGKDREVTQGATVRDLLVELDLHPELVVVERNGEILDRDRYGGTEVETGDRLELVHFVGGG